MDNFPVALLYGDLIHVADLVDLDGGERANRLSALVGSTGFLQHVGLTPEDSIGHELFDQPTIEAWISTKSGSTKRASLSRFRWWQIQYKKLISAQELPTDPRERLAAAIEVGLARRGITVKELAAETGICATSLSKYRHRAAMFSSVYRLRTLEKALELLPGTLDGVIDTERRGEPFCSSKRMPSEFQGTSSLARRRRRKLRWSLPSDFPALPEEKQNRELTHWVDVILSDERQGLASRRKNSPYSLFFEHFPPRVKDEWEAFSTFKTSEVLPRSKRRHKRGRVRRPSTLNNHLRFLQWFFGWYLLPTREQHVAEHGSAPEDDFLIGFGGTRDELTLGLLAVPHLVEAFVQWRFNVRAPGANTNTPSLLMQIGTFVHPEYGFLTQHPEIVGRIPERHKARYIKDFSKHLRSAINDQRALTSAINELDEQLAANEAEKAA